MLNSDSLARLMAANGLTLGESDLVTRLDGLPDATVAAYADDYLQYNAAGQVTSETVAGSGTTTYQSYTNPPGATPLGINDWSNEEIVTNPNGMTVVTFYNYEGDTLLTDTWNGLPGIASEHWVTYNQYDADGNLVESAQPSAINSSGGYYDSTAGYLEHGYNSSYADLHVQLNQTSGLINVNAYYPATWAISDGTGDPSATEAGGVEGCLWATGVQQGSQGTPVWQTSVDYVVEVLDFTSVHEVCHSTQYQDGYANPSPPDPTAAITGAETTTYQYTFFPISGAVTAPAIYTQSTTLPAVDAAHGGSGVPSTSTDVYNQLGQVVWSQDADGSISYTAYDRATGAVVEQVQDANVNAYNSGEYPAADWALLPPAWQTTAATPLNYVTTYQVDSQGRTVEETDPAGNVTFTVYQDAAQTVIDGSGTAVISNEVRTYSGWKLNFVTGKYVQMSDPPPTQVTCNVDSTQGSYSETLTMRPHPTWIRRRAIPQAASRSPAWRAFPARSPTTRGKWSKRTTTSTSPASPIPRLACKLGQPTPTTMQAPAAMMRWAISCGRWMPTATSPAWSTMPWAGRSAPGWARTTPAQPSIIRPAPHQTTWSKPRLRCTIMEEWATATSRKRSTSRTVPPRPQTPFA